MGAIELSCIDLTDACTRPGSHMCNEVRDSRGKPSLEPSLKEKKKILL